MLLTPCAPARKAQHVAKAPRESYDIFSEQMQQHSVQCFHHFFGATIHPIHD